MDVGVINRVEQDEEGLVDQIIFALSGAVEAKDRYTNGHSQRVAGYAREMMKRLGWGEEEQRKAYRAGMLHDVGKIRIPDAIISKADRLTEDEDKVMKLHTMAGYYLIKEVSAISTYAAGARWHHERFDGKGYPNGLSGENIPLVARVIAVADAYDAMTSTRSYRTILPQDEVKAELRKGMGTQFDPAVAWVMLGMVEEDKNYELREHSLKLDRTILAIDDDPMVLRLLQFALKDKPGYRIFTAGSGREGIEILSRKKVELVLLDVEMPEMDGFQVLQWIRERDRDLPVTFMTGDKELEIIHRAEEMGISDYLTKPLVVNMLWESIQNVLASSWYIDRQERLPRMGGSHD